MKKTIKFNVKTNRFDVIREKPVYVSKDSPLEKLGYKALGFTGFAMFIGLFIYTIIGGWSKKS